MKATKDVRTNKETHRSIARQLFMVKIFSKLYLEAATKRYSLKLMFLLFQSEMAAKIVGNITQDRKSFITQSKLMTF